MRLRVSRRTRPTDVDEGRRALVLQAGAVLLDYPDDEQALSTVDAAFETRFAAGTPESLVRGFLDVWLPLEGMQREIEYVATFDQRARCSLNLTFHTDGDTRHRGERLLAVRRAYVDLGVTPPAAELPDFLPALLELAAVEPAAVSVLVENLPALGALKLALDELASPFAGVVEAVLGVLPPPSAADRAETERLAREGPPAEAVGIGDHTSGTAATWGCGGLP